MNHDHRAVREAGDVTGPGPMALRLLVYALVTAAVFQCVVIIAIDGHADLLGSEYGPIECAQLVLALVAGAVLLTAARRGDTMPTVLTIGALAAWFAAAREADRFLADILFSDANKIVMTAVAVLAVVVMIRGRGRIGAELALLVRTSGFQFLFCGWLVVVVYAQITGQKQLWQAVMGDSYLRSAKNTLEELPELFGYLLLVFGGFEAWVLERFRS